MRYKVGCILLTLAVLVPGGLVAKERAQQLPLELYGTWADELDECTKPDSDGLLKIGPQFIDSYSLKLTVRRVRRLGDGAIEASGMAQVEGEARPVPTTVELRQLTPEQLKVMDQTFFRCTHSFG